MALGYATAPEKRIGYRSDGLKLAASCVQASGTHACSMISIDIVVDGIGTCSIGKRQKGEDLGRASKARDTLSIMCASLTNTELDRSFLYRDVEELEQ